MKTLLNADDRTAICRRVGEVTDRKPMWGRMDATAMLAHLTQSARMALGDMTVPSAKKWFLQVFPLKHLILYVLPFPKGVQTAPELLSGPRNGLEEARTGLVGLLERMGSETGEGQGPVHPAFGRLTRRQWGVLMHKHVDHHLKQFGV